jgi:hypothetical protein
MGEKREELRNNKGGKDSGKERVAAGWIKGGIVRFHIFVKLNLES